MAIFDVDYSSQAHAGDSRFDFGDGIAMDNGLYIVLVKLWKENKQRS